MPTILLKLFRKAYILETQKNIKAGGRGEKTWRRLNKEKKEKWKKTKDKTGNKKKTCKKKNKEKTLKTNINEITKNKRSETPRKKRKAEGQGKKLDDY